MALDTSTLHQRLFELQLSSTYLTMVKALIDGPKTAVELADAAGMDAVTVRIRVCQLRTKLERQGLTVSKMGDGPVPNGGPPRTYELIEVAKPAAPVEPEPEAPAVDEEEVAGWVPDF